MARRWILRKRSIPILLVTVLVYVVLRPLSFPALLHYDRPPSSPPPAQRGTTPIYEYNSLYRAHASADLEDEIDRQLLAIEYEVTNGAVLKAAANIWQIGTPAIARQWETFIEQWRTNNPEWSHNLVSDDAGEKFLREKFETVPKLVEVYEGFPLAVLKADILRYMLLWYNGGLYVDADTWDRVALRDCQPVVSILQEKKDVSLLVGVEIDEPFLSAATMEAWHWSRNFGFAQFTMFAPQRFDPMLRTAIVRAVSHAMVHEESSKWLDVVEGTRYTESDILEITGPGMFTDVILDLLDEGIGGMHGLRDRDAGLERRVTWKGFHQLRGPVWVQGESMVSGRGKGRGIGVLPINVWGSGQRHSGSGTFNEENACINHVFGRAWKKGWWEWAFG